MTLFWGITITATALLLGTLLVWLGRRGKRLDGHPVCRKCRYDLSGSVGGGGALPEACPECGRSLAERRAVANGNRRPRPIVLTSGFVLVALGVGLLGVSAYGLYLMNGSVQNSPTWVLIAQTVYLHDATAAEELEDRGRVGQLTAADYQQIVPAAQKTGWRVTGYEGAAKTRVI